MRINLAEINAKINEDDIERKTEKIYCNNHAIKRILPFINYTDNIDDVREFFLKHILNRGRPRKLVKKEDN